MFRPSMYARTVALGLLLWACLGLPAEARPEDTLLGKPVPVGSSHQDEEPLEKNEYTLGFSGRRFQPYWVSWMVNKESIGNAPRANRFHKERELQRYESALPSDYKKSGFDRGHLCPSADRTATKQANRATFSMANMVPQVKELNRGPWKELEEYCRDLVDNDYKLFIVAGEYGNAERKVNDKIAVPTRCWKVIVVLPPDLTSASQVTDDTRVIAVDMPNSPSIKGKDWTDYICSVRQIEEKTKYNLLSNVERSVQDVIEVAEDEGDDDAY